MTFPIGNARQLGQELFPEGFVPDVLDLIVRTWSEFRLPSDVRLEVPITALFRIALENRYADENKDWFVTLEEPNVDPVTGIQVSRTDLRFLPPGIKRANRAFVLESKRLNTPSGSNVSAYVGDDGMMRFVTGRYSLQHSCGGMMGYVINGNIPKAKTSIVTAIKKHQEKLKLFPQTGYARCPFTSAHPHNGKTRHQRSNGEFVIYHLLLAVS